MSPSNLPFWRRSVIARFACIAVAILPAIALHTWKFDPGLPMRFAWLAAFGAGMTLLISAWPPPSPARLGHGQPVRRRDLLPSSLLAALTGAALLASLWPAGDPTWPSVAGWTLALAVQRALGGWAVNPFPPELMALAVAVALARFVSGSDVAPPLVSLFDAGIVASGWIAAGVLLVLLRLRTWRAPLAFFLPVLLVCFQGGIAATSFVTAAIVASLVVADTRHLPATRSGQIAVGALAGLGTALLWFSDAPPVAIACPCLLAFALSPWIERVTTPRLDLSP
ncbi:hypothetical protein OS176_06985 [Xanthomonadaceae bacterium XH05]|nr:hypothetical protein [Xanthomonadaceae bacterium XH05]